VSDLVRALVADDEAPARARVVALLARRPTYDVVAECGSGTATLAAIEAHRPDLVFLDVQMPGMSGIEVWRGLEVSPRPVVVFTTAYDQYALDAFEARAIDYLLKPYSDERFDEALDRAERQMRGERLGRWQGRLRELLAEFASVVTADGVARDAGSYVERFAVRERDRVLIVPVEDVEWIEAARDYVRLHVGARRYLVRMTMQGLDAKLDPKRFVRVHRSAIVQVDRIVGIEPYLQGDDLVILRDATRVRVGRTYRDSVRARVGLDQG